MRRIIPLLLVAAWACVPPGEATLEINPVTKTLKNDGRAARVAVVATDAKGQVGTGTVHLVSSAGSLTDGVDLPLDAYGTATQDFSCDVAKDTACDGTVRLTATWKAGTQTVTGEATIAVSAQLGTGGGSGGGGGAPTDLDSITCPPAGTNGMWITISGAPNPVVKTLLPSANPNPAFGATRIEPTGCTLMTCNFFEFQGQGDFARLMLLSIGSPTGKPFVLNELETTGTVGSPTVFRLQVAATGYECQSLGDHFKLTAYGFSPSSGWDIEVRFGCLDYRNAARPPITGCLKFTGT